MDASNLVKKLLWVLGRKVSRLSVIHIVRKILVLVVLLPLLPMAVPYPYTWDAGHLSYAIQATCMAFLAYRLTPYTRLHLKSLLAAFTAFSVLDVALYPSRYLMAPYIVYGLEVCVAFIFLLYIHHKFYNIINDDLDDKHIFMVAAKPHNLRQLVVSMFCQMPIGGVGVYAGGNWYHYRRKSCQLEKTTSNVFRAVASNYHIIEIGPNSDRAIARLDAIVGIKWTPTRNCITQLRPILESVNE